MFDCSFLKVSSMKKKEKMFTPRQIQIMLTSQLSSVCLTYFFISLLASKAQLDACCVYSLGLTCPDPGRPPDGRQVNSSSYDEGAVVYFQCDREGFTLSDPFPLMCQLNNSGNGFEWNSTIPQCVGELGSHLNWKYFLP